MKTKSANMAKRSNADAMTMFVTICCLHPMLAGPPIGACGRGSRSVSSSPLAAEPGCHSHALALSTALPGENLLRLRGGQNAVDDGGANDINDALQVLDAYSPCHKRVLVRGMPKQARTSGAKKTVKKGSKKETKEERAARKRSELKLHQAPWRWQKDLENMQGDTGWYKGKEIEVRKRTIEGNHILRVGYVDSYKSRTAAKEKLKTTKEMQEELWEREASIKKLKTQIQEVQSSGGKSVPNEWGIVQALPGSARTLEVVQGKLVKKERELVRFKDGMDGTSNWKNLTAHTGKLLILSRTHGGARRRRAPKLPRALWI